MPSWIATSEALALFLALAVSVNRPKWGAAIWGKVESLLAHSRPWVTAMILFAAPLVIRGILLVSVRIPSPVVMDEFSYLLGGDTFALGRLANPSPAVPEAFRAAYMLVTPSYVSTYPPAQAVVLAAGKLIFGHPWWGIFLSVGLMAVTTEWMLRPFVSRGTAFVSALIIVLQLGVFSYWMNSYWGGTVAAIGANLVVGAYGRLRHVPNIGAAIAFTAGAMVLGLRRPYEAVVVVSLVVALIGYDWWHRKGGFTKRSFLQTIGPVLTGGVVLLMSSAWYNLRCTGDWETFPYVLGSRTASDVPEFIFQRLRPHVTVPDNLISFATERFTTYEREHTFDGYWRVKADQYRPAAALFLRPTVTVLLIAGVIAAWAGRCWRLLIADVVGALALMIEVPGHPHYLAPFLPLYSLLIALGFEALCRWAPRTRPVGPAIATVVVLVFLCAIGLTAVLVICGKDLPPVDAQFACCGLNRAHPRESVEEMLGAQPGRKLVLVTYGPYNSAFYEWVYNAADLPNAAIIWARDLGAESNQRLARAFPGRDIWQLEVGTDPSGAPNLRRLSAALQ